MDVHHMGYVSMIKIKIAEWLAVIATISIIVHGILRYSPSTVNHLADIAKQIING
jgi:hypothetical protein